jgi:hypothetical protein
MCPLKATRPATACGEPARDVERAPKLLNDIDSLNMNTAERLANFAGGRWLGDHGVTRCPSFLRKKIWRSIAANAACSDAAPAAATGAPSSTFWGSYHD